MIQNSFEFYDRKARSRLVPEPLTSTILKKACTRALGVMHPSTRRTTSSSLVAAGLPISTASLGLLQDTRIELLACSGLRLSAPTVEVI